MIRQSSLNEAVIWYAEIKDGSGVVVRRMIWSGSLQNYEWDGKDEHGVLVPQGLYSYHLTSEDRVKNKSTFELRPIRVDTEPSLPSLFVYFKPYSTDFRSIDPKRVTASLQAIETVVDILKRFVAYSLIIEGHAARVLWYDKNKYLIEEREVLIPLSEQRAGVIKEELVARGISKNRIEIKGFGGFYPAILHNDLENRWMNRRVEFVLINRDF